MPVRWRWFPVLAAVAAPGAATTTPVATLPPARGSRAWLREEHHVGPPWRVIRSHAFELNGHPFDMPHAVDWEESDLKVADCLPGRGAGAGRPRDDDKRDAVEAALTDAPQSVRNIARTARVARSTVQDILAELAEDGDASKLDNGWVSGNSGHLITGHPQGDPENRSTKPNQVSENRSENGAHRTPGDAITGHPNGHDADAVLDRLREKFPDLEAVEVAARCACGDRALPDTDEDGDGQCARCGRGTA